MTVRKIFRGNKAVLIFTALIIILCAVIYAKSIKVPFIYDDWNSIVENPQIRKIWPIWKAMSSPPQSGIEDRPIVCLSLAINYAIGEYDTKGYHIFNLILHILSTLVLMGIVRRTLLLPKFKKKFQNSAYWLAFSAAVIWAIHPLLTEAVTYIIQRTELLMGLFYLLTLYCSIRYWTSQNKKFWLITAVLSCATGMGSKEVMFSAPLIIVIYNWLFISGSFQKSYKDNKLLYSGLFLTWILLFVFIARGPENKTIGFRSGVSSTEYLLTQAGVILHYLRLSIWPHPLVISYYWPYVRTVADSIPESLAMLMLLIGTFYALYRKHWTGFLGVWFFFILAPSSSIVPIVTEVAAERRMYLSLISVVIFAVIFGYQMSFQLSKKFKIKNKLTTAIRAVLAIAVVAGFSFITNNRLNDYKTRVSIWTDAVKRYPQNDHALNNLGIALEEQGKIEEAIYYYKEAIKYKYSNSEAHNNLGITLYKQGKVEESIVHFENAIKVKPDYANAFVNLGLALDRLGKRDEAIANFKKALQIDPNFSKARTALGSVLTQTEDPGKAISHFSNVLRSSPDDTEANYHLGVALKKQGKTNSAIRHFNKVLKIDPDHAETYNQLGIIATELGQLDKAEIYFKKALKIKPDFTNALSNFGELLNRKGKFSEAASNLSKALEINKNFESAHLNLGISLAQQGQLDSAVYHFNEALRINPKYEKAYFNLGNAMAIKGRYSEAIFNFSEASKINPDNAQTHNNLGILYTRQARYKEAVKHLTEALRIQPDYESAKKNLEFAREQLGKR